MPSLPALTEKVSKLKTQLSEAESTRRHKAIKDAGGNLSEAARLLGVHRVTLDRWVKDRPGLRAKIREGQEADVEPWRRPGSEDAVAAFRATLDTTEAQVFDVRLMAEEPEQPSALAARLSLSRQRVHQIEQRLKKKLSARLPPP